ncbi:hypothetical protein [Arthrobacter sp. ES3-54]|uniref:hypothetical protein n=1 Tax=Arthrobacter sp. ES3-54 TaxID=1502991 RepID=UPI002406A98E|nr:hypothetical protein [Arthrobacter sp. ES3-54]MDF9749175.1 hypothetical protein [Arthrobacter sp. ES3-54]
MAQHQHANTKRDDVRKFLIYLYRTFLVLVVLLSILAIVINGTSLLQGPMSETAPNAADWMSAISTFWGAVAGGIGAIGTAGALLIAAFTYKHQVDERNRVEAERRRKEWDQRSAEARNVAISFDDKSTKGQMECVVHNRGDVPLDSVLLVFDYTEGKNSIWEVRSVGPLGPKTDSKPLKIPSPATANSHCTFRDTKARTWNLYFDGRLEEQAPDTKGPFSPKHPLPL